MEGRFGLSKANTDTIGPGRDRRKPQSYAAAADDAFHLRMQGFGYSCGAHFAALSFMAPQLCRMRLRCAAASPQMPLLPLGYRAASTLGMACCSVQSQPAFALQGRDGRPALGTSARSLQSQAARAARRKKGSGHYALRPIYATCKGLPPEGKLHCSHLSLQNASRLQRGIGINENGAVAMCAGDRIATKEGTHRGRRALGGPSRLF